MSAEAELCARLKADDDVSELVDGRVYPTANTQEATYPLLIYQTSGYDRPPTLAGRSRLSKSTITVTAYAETEAEAIELMAAVRECLQGQFGNVKLCKADGNGSADVDADGTRLISQDFSVWYRN